jgi:DnaJ-domain-containing protein 1
LPILLAGVAAIVLLFLVRGYSLANSKALLKQLRFSAGLTLALLCLSLLATRRIDLAIAAGITAAILLFGSGGDWRNILHRGAAGFGTSGGRRPSPPRAAGMSHAEAYKVLGLDEGASEDAIRAAHRRLIIQNHPDKGGSTYLAAKINEAKDTLLRT